MARTRLLLAAVTLALSMDAACAGPNLPYQPSSAPSADSSSAPVGAVVTLQNVSFVPSVVNIVAGQAVEWRWADGGIPHNVTFAAFHSDTRTTGRFFHTFAVHGRYEYRCTIHGTMFGTVVVR